MTITLDLAHLLSSTAPEDAPARRTLSSLSLAVARAKRVVVVTGAGISCSCGIPDFRSSDGLYNLVKSRYPTSFVRGKDLFDASLFRSPETTSLFYTFIAELKRAVDAAEPGATHRFLSALEGRGRLLRCYTQNIDGLEERAGLGAAGLPSASAPAATGAKAKEDKENAPPSSSPRSTPSSPVKGQSSSKPPPAGKKPKSLKSTRNVQLHGDIHSVRCTLCSYTTPHTPSHTESFLSGQAPQCPACVSRCEARLARAARALPQGHLRPAIVLYDEPHPLGEEIGQVQTADLARSPDLLIIMGTSLKVHGLKRLVKDFASAVHARAEASRLALEAKGKAPPQGAGGMLGKVIFVNRTPPPGEWEGVIDYHVMGETDVWVERVEEEWRRARPQDWEVQTTLDALPVSLPAVSTTAAGKAKAMKAMKVSKPAVATISSKAKARKEPKKAAKPSRRGVADNSSDTENIPLSQASTLSASSASSISSEKTLVSGSPSKPKSSPTKEPRAPLAPLSPSKRQAQTCHYTDPDSSPQKRHSPSHKSVQSSPTKDFPEKGMLFGSPSKAARAGGKEDQENLGLGELRLETPPRRRGLRRGRGALAEVRA